MAGLCAPLPTLRPCLRGQTRTARGRCGSLLLHRSGLAPLTPCRSPNALITQGVQACLWRSCPSRWWNLARCLLAPPVLADQVCGVEPQVRPFPLDRPIEERVHTRVDALTQLGYLALGDARTSHRLYEIVDLAGEVSLGPGPQSGPGKLTEGETPWIQASWITATSACSVVRRGSRKPGN